MLSYDSIVTVDLEVSASPAPSSVFDTGLFLSRSAPFTDLVRSFTSPEAMLAAGFTQSSPDYKAALKYFGVSPAPTALLIAKVPENTTFPEAFGKVINKTRAFYGVMCIGATDSEQLILLPGLEATGSFMLFCPVTGTFTDVTAPSGLFSRLQSTGTRRALPVYLNSQEDGAAVMGLAMGLARVCTRNAFSLCFKTLNKVSTIPLSIDQVETIKAMNGNVYVTRGNSRDLLEPGTTPSGARYDEVLYMDMIASDLRDVCVKLLADQTMRLPQNDTATALFFNVISATLDAYVARGVLGPAMWQGAPVGTIEAGDRVEGYALFAESYDLQPYGDRVAHRAMPISVLLCFTGSVESVLLTVRVQE